MAFPYIPHRQVRLDDLLSIHLCPHAMQISHEASFGARVLETGSGAHRILPLSVSVQGQRCRLVVGRSEHELPPYRIENRCHNQIWPMQPSIWTDGQPTLVELWLMLF